MKVKTPKEDPRIKSARDAAERRADASFVADTGQLLDEETRRRIRKFGKRAGATVRGAAGRAAFGRGAGGTVSGGGGGSVEGGGGILPGYSPPSGGRSATGVTSGVTL